MIKFLYFFIKIALSLRQIRIERQRSVTLNFRLSVFREINKKLCAIGFT
jgi:hypothetical protein